MYFMSKYNFEDEDEASAIIPGSPFYISVLLKLQLQFVQLFY